SYTVNVRDATGCSNTATISLTNTNDIFYGTVESNPREPSVGEDFQVIIHPTSSWNFDYSSTSGFTFRDTLIVLNYPDYGYYILQYYLTSINGCKYNFPYDFFVKDYMTIYFPNSFTANADGLNDFYLPVGTLVKEFKMQIFDRWGEQLFSTDDFYKGWDGKYKGKPAEEAVYTYKAWAKDYYDHQSTFIGHFTLIR
ncbi:MAG: T9SS type B sorting domain-containing protein, partial [Bacteroidia bacterium]